MTRHQRLVLLAAILGSGVATLDGSIVNVALPSIEQDLGGGLAGQQWVSNAYLLALASLILVGGSLGDIYGERRIFTIGVAAFGVMSVACALAPTMNALIAARALQGAAGALLAPSSLAIIVTAFPQRERGARDRLVDGVGRDRVDHRPARGRRDRRRRRWRWVFALNIPVVIATLVADRPGRTGRRRASSTGTSTSSVRRSAWSVSAASRSR